MSTVINGDETSFWTGITVPADGDGKIKVDDVNVPFQALLDNTAYLKKRFKDTGGETAAHTFTATTPTTWTAGVNDRRARLRAWGAGGGGGGGAHSLNGTDKYAGGGAGGGAPLAQELDLEVTPGVTYEIVCGAGGAGGAAGPGDPGVNDGSNGSAGGDTIFRVQGGATLATFKGAQGGGGGFLSTVSSPTVSLGGTPVVLGRPQTSGSTISASGFVYGPGFGGDGGSTTATSPGAPSRNGATSIEGFAGGAAGTRGSDSTNHGGGAGGGGAGAVSGVGGNAPAATHTGTPGSGAGGGGGGGGGAGATDGGIGTAGDAGVSGSCTLRVIG